MDPRLPSVLAPTLECYVSLIDQRLPEFLNAFYIVGSIALEEFNPQFSDVDFIAVLRQPANEQEIETLRSIHQEVERQHPRWKLSGMYLLESEIGKATGDVPKLIGFHDGVLHAQTNFELNPVTWWILKNRGLTLRGPDPRLLPIQINAKALVEWTRENMNTYWKSWTRRPIRLLTLLTDWGIQWAVLGISRQLYTIREQTIISKQRAGEYALATLPVRWQAILEEAIRIRRGSAGSYYRSRLTRLMEAVAFMNFIMKTSNDYFEAMYHG